VHPPAQQGGWDPGPRSLESAGWRPQLREGEQRACERKAGIRSPALLVTLSECSMRKNLDFSPGHALDTGVGEEPLVEVEASSHQASVSPSVKWEPRLSFLPQGSLHAPGLLKLGIQSPS
jgi:hypothetical protein